MKTPLTPKVAATADHMSRRLAKAMTAASVRRRAPRSALAVVGEQRRRRKCSRQRRRSRRRRCYCRLQHSRRRDRRRRKQPFFLPTTPLRPRSSRRRCSTNCLCSSSQISNGDISDFNRRFHGFVLFVRCRYVAFFSLIVSRLRARVSAKQTQTFRLYTHKQTSSSRSVDSRLFKLLRVSNYK